jgi:hypothetical protein
MHQTERGRQGPVVAQQVFSTLMLHRHIGASAVLTQMDVQLQPKEVQSPEANQQSQLQALGPREASFSRARTGNPSIRA